MKIVLIVFAILAVISWVAVMLVGWNSKRNKLISVILAIATVVFAGISVSFYAVETLGGNEGESVVEDISDEETTIVFETTTVPETTTVEETSFVSETTTAEETTTALETTTIQSLAPATSSQETTTNWLNYGGNVNE